MQIAVPSRTDVPEYQRLRSMVHEVVGRINGQYGTLTHVPIYHLDRQLSFNELVALYAITDVALVTSRRDGMNLGACGAGVCAGRVWDGRGRGLAGQAWEGAWWQTDPCPLPCCPAPQTP